MFKDAVLFHLHLCKQLSIKGICLKDALPNNILFNNTTPIFIDFLSLIFTEDIKNEEWLFQDVDDKNDNCIIIKKMFIPYMLIPLLIMYQKNYNKARQCLRDKCCNNKNLLTTNWDDIEKMDCRIKELSDGIYNVMEKRNIDDIYDYLIKKIELLDVTPSKSGYLTYYNDKKENFNLKNIDNWLIKQKNIYKILSSNKYNIVMDIGSNTGWFSLLAESMGSKVISLDIDESSIDALYLYAKENNLNILPLKMSFDDLTKEFYGFDYNSDNILSNVVQSSPLFLMPIERFKVDLVLCLGLLHHLLLGEGKNISDVIKILSKVTDTLVVEFVSLEDSLIKDNPDFFANLHLYSKDNYNLKFFKDKIELYFPKITIMDSHPCTRKILLCEK